MINSWILTGAQVACDSQSSERLDIEICSGKIITIASSIKMRRNVHYLDLKGCLILPGLINAHDHLEFNLFPRMGRGPYQSAETWALDIHHPKLSPIKEHLSIPLEARLRWGALKNLLSGVTTVCHHNPYHSHIFLEDFVVRVPRRYGWAHSFQFSPNLLERFKKTPVDWPFVLHLGEAVNQNKNSEVIRLNLIGALDHRTVMVHAVALGPRDLDLVRKKGASIVWCPSSNIFVLGRTLSCKILESGITIALGTDSALSGIGDLLDEIRFAHRISRVSASRLYDMVTKNPAQIMRLTKGQGLVAQGGIADFLVVKNSTMTPAAAILKLQTGDMEIMFVSGRVKLASPDRFAQLPAVLRRSMNCLELEESGRRVFIEAELHALVAQTEPILGSIMLAHKKVKLS